MIVLVLSTVDDDNEELKDSKAHHQDAKQKPGLQGSY